MHYNLTGTRTEQLQLHVCIQSSQSIGTLQLQFLLPALEFKVPMQNNTVSAAASQGSIRRKTRNL